MKLFYAPRSLSDSTQSDSLQVSVPGPAYKAFEGRTYPFQFVSIEQREINFEMSYMLNAPISLQITQSAR